MSFNVAMLKAMQAEGLDLAACIRVLEAGEKRADPTAAERKRRQRAKGVSRVTSRRDPPNDIDILTPHEVSEPEGSSPQPWACPVGVEKQVWADFMLNRKRKRCPSTATAWKAFTDDLRRISTQTGIPPPKLIEHAAAKGWAGIYDPKEIANDRTASKTIAAATAAFGSPDTWADDQPF